jgi:hypothetical protein
MSRKNNKQRGRSRPEAESQGRGDEGRPEAGSRALPFAEGVEPREEDDGGSEEPIGIAQFVSQRPVTTLVAAFGVGFGVGVLAAAILGPEPRRRRGPSWAEPLQGFAGTLQKLPGQVADRIPDALQKLPGQVADRIPDVLKWRIG